MKAAGNSATADASTISSAYNIFYFDQTSYHLHVKKIDLHLCDDAHTASGKLYQRMIVALYKLKFRLPTRLGY